MPRPGHEGEDQYPFWAMASIISLQAMGWSVSARTWAAASSALSFLALSSTWADFFRVFLGLPFW